MHPDLEALAMLVGTWEGRGHGEYPTIDPFDYDERVRFADTGKRFLVYQQRTTDSVTGDPLHVESGYWRPSPPDRVEVVVSHPTGHAEVSEGFVSPGRIELRSVAVNHTTTAKRVDAVERIITVDGDTLRYAMWMAAVGEPLTQHLSAELARVDE
ncbi:MAG: FABP family protein [Acidimicrobiales bacterium]|nr:FABP family protein [Acidimicrobiales bacterium]